MQYHKIQAKYEVTTPMFLSGADQQKAELRTASIKGVLRFWFRATALGQENNWLTVKKLEEDLFGTADSGQGNILIKVHKVNNLKVTETGQEWKQAGSAYLGYGPINWVKEKKKLLTVRPYVFPGTSFIVEAIFKPRKDENQHVVNEKIKAIKRSLTALGLFGGLGSRSRHGFGSITLASLTFDGKEEWNKPNGRDDLLNQINSFIAGLGPLLQTVPEYTAFSNESRIAITLRNRDMLKLLNDIGEELMMYRSYGRTPRGGGTHKVLGRQAEQNFIQDHNIALNFASTGRATTHPERVAFGLPHNYSFSNGSIKVDVNADKLKRRASPLFIHIHSLEKEYIAVLTLLPATFLPSDDNIKLANTSFKALVNTNVNYKVIHDFIDRFAERLEVTF